MNPETTELEWRKLLDNCPVWQPPLIKTLVLSPHPDDETLGAGGLIADLIANDVDVSLISVSDGENAYPLEKTADLRRVRIAEQNAALAILGLPESKIIRLQLTDSDIQASEPYLETYLLSIIDQPVNLLASWTNDFHPDHEAVGRVAQRVAEKTQSSLFFYFFWTWHRGDPAMLAEHALQRYPLSQNAWQLKQKAIQCYQSQLVNNISGAILPPHLLLPTQRPFEVYLSL